MFSMFVLEFKVGDNSFGKSAELQVIDYCLDLKNFHEGSHFAKLVPLLVATNPRRNWKRRWVEKLKGSLSPR